MSPFTFTTYELYLCARPLQYENLIKHSRTRRCHWRTGKLWHHYIVTRKTANISEGCMHSQRKIGMKWHLRHSLIYMHKKLWHFDGSETFFLLGKEVDNPCTMILKRLTLFVKIPMSHLIHTTSSPKYHQKSIITSNTKRNLDSRLEQVVSK